MESTLFKVSREWVAEICQMNNEDAGEFTKAMLLYGSSGCRTNLPESLTEVYERAVAEWDEQRSRDILISKRRSISGKKGAVSKWKKAQTLDTP